MVIDKYALNRGYVEATRLGCQHYLWKETLNYLVHPSVPLDHESLRIADIGAGTGIWSLDLAKSLPSARIDGFDISASAFPPKNWLPDNVSLRVLDAFDDPPEELWGQYDIVHLRLFLLVVGDNNPTRLLNHFTKLLKSGGFLQWEEYDLHAQKVVIGNSLVQTKNLEALIKLTTDQRPSEWVAALPQSCKNHNLTLVTVSRLHEDRRLTRMWTEIDLVLADEYAANFLDIKGPPGSGDELRQLAKAVYSDVQQGGSIERTLQVVVARKH